MVDVSFTTRFTAGLVDWVSLLKFPSYVLQATTFSLGQKKNGEDHREDTDSTEAPESTLSCDCVLRNKMFQLN